MFFMPSEESTSRLRAMATVKREFLVRSNVIEADEKLTRRELNGKVQELSQTERKALEARMQNRLDRLEELMDGESKSFDQPRAEPEDLIEDVYLPVVRHES
jgi:hypothetical protein